MSVSVKRFPVITLGSALVDFEESSRLARTAKWGPLPAACECWALLEGPQRNLPEDRKTRTLSYDLFRSAAMSFAAIRPSPQECLLQPSGRTGWAKKSLELRMLRVIGTSCCRWWSRKANKKHVLVNPCCVILQYSGLRAANHLDRQSVVGFP